MPKCTYCGRMYEFPRGLTLISIDGTVNHLCSSKCRKNMKLKRRKVRWISKDKKSSDGEAILSEQARTLKTVKKTAKSKKKKKKS